MNKDQNDLSQDAQIEKEISPQRGAISQLLFSEGLDHT